jgi:hypothetical protein
MVIRERGGRTTGQGRLMAWVGLAMALGMVLPAEAQIQRSPTTSTASLGTIPATPAMAMDGHSTDGHGENDPSANPELEDLNQPRPSAPSPVELVTAAHGNHFTVGFPQGWTITHAETSPLLKAQSPTEPAITTEISWYAEAPGQVFAALMADIQAEGHTVARYDAITMDGTTAIRLWLTDLPESEPAHAFLSVVGYGNTTALLVSRYDAPSHDLDNLLSQIHQSFRRMTPSAAEPQSAPADGR